MGKADPEAAKLVTKRWGRIQVTLTGPFGGPSFLSKGNTMKARNDARLIERALSRAADNAIDLMHDPEALAGLGDAICELGYAHLAPGRSRNTGVPVGVERSAEHSET